MSRHAVLDALETPPEAPRRPPLRETRRELGDVALVERACPPDATDVPRLVREPGGSVAFAYAVAVDGRRVERALVIPPGRLAPAQSDAAGPMPALRPGSSTRLVVRYLDALAAAVGELGAGDARAVADAAVELIAGALDARARDERERRRAALRDEVRRHIRGRLGDPLLSIQSIACAHAMSVRALHALFEGSGESVMRIVRAERLRRCRQDLERPDSGTVSEIAVRWGLGGSAHFSRVFKREFGRPPSDVRTAALARQSSGTLRATV